MAAKRRKPTPTWVARAVFERRALVTLQAIKFTKPYRDAWAAVVTKHGASSVSRALERQRRSPSAAADAAERDLLRLARHFNLPTRVPVDPDRLEDLPDIAATARTPRGWWGPERLGVRVVRGPAGGPGAVAVARVDLDFTHPDTELAAGLALLRDMYAVAPQQRPEDYGLAALGPQPEFVATHEVRVDASLWRRPSDIEAGLRLLRARTEAPPAPSRRSGRVVDGRVLPKTGRTLRERGWEGPEGWERAFRLLLWTRPPSNLSLARAVERDHGRPWRDSEIAARRSTEASARRLVRQADAVVRDLERDLSLLPGMHALARVARRVGAAFTSVEEAETAALDGMRGTTAKRGKDTSR